MIHSKSGGIDMGALFNNLIISSWADRQDYEVKFNCG